MKPVSESKRHLGMCTEIPLKTSHWSEIMSVKVLLYDWKEGMRLLRIMRASVRCSKCKYTEDTNDAARSLK